MKRSLLSSLLLSSLSLLVLSPGCGGGAAPDDLAMPVDATIPVDASTPIDLEPLDMPFTPPTVLLPKQAFVAADIAMLVNLDDPQSVAVGAHYQMARSIPAPNVVSLHLGPNLGTTIDAATFATWKMQIDQATPMTVQAFAVTWIQPSIVCQMGQSECMSLTSALALGFETKYTNTTNMSCGMTAASPYYDTGSFTPFTSLNVRPAMILAGANAMEAIALIDRGVAADNTFPTGDGYMITTTDATRSSRTPEFVNVSENWTHPEELNMMYLDNSSGMGSDFIQNKMNVMFYFTGLTNVPMLATNQYRPGAIADHLTSFGGQIPNSGQMSILKWIEGGVTGSYGTVVEPCNYVQKFPDPTIVLPTYYSGATLIEAYWQSVEWPGEGLFIGEPLAKPWGTYSTIEGRDVVITSTAPQPGGSYKVQSGPSANGPWTDVLGMGSITAAYNRKSTITVKDAKFPFYKFSMN